MTTPLTSPIKGPERIEQPAARNAASSGRRFALPLDPLLTLAVVGLGIASVMTLRTATREAVLGDPNYYVTRQVVYLTIGLILMVVLARVDYARLRPLKNGIYALLILSILAVLGLGHETKGSTRAISLPFFSFQASELGKVLLILALAAFIVDRARRLRERDTTARVMLAALVPAMLVIAQPDLGSGMVYMAVAFVMLLVAGAPWQQLGGLVALVCVSVAVVLVAAPAIGVHVLKPYQTERLTAFLHPSANFEEIKEKESKTGEPDPRYQLAQSKIAIGSGQKTGRGSDSTQLTGNYLPEDDTDFAFAAVGEQYGFLGAGLVLCLYGAADLANAAHPHDVEGPVRLARGGGRSGYADVSGVRQRGDDHWDHAHYRRHAAAHELWRFVGDHHPVGGGPAAINLCSGTCFSGAEGPRADLLDTDTMSANHSRSPAVDAPPRILLRPSPVRDPAGIDTERLDHIEKASACQRRSRGDARGAPGGLRNARRLTFGLHQAPQARKRRPGGRLSNS